MAKPKQVACSSNSERVCPCPEIGEKVGEKRHAYNHQIQISSGASSKISVDVRREVKCVYFWSGHSEW